MSNQEVFFKDIKNKILEHINQCEEEILIAVAWFTDLSIISALKKNQKKGIKINILIYDNFINDEKIFKDLIEGGAIVKKSTKLMHNKFCVIDRKIILNGSYNWTVSAKYNNENLHVIKYDENLTYQFIVEYFNIFNNEKSKLIQFKSKELVLNEFISRHKFSLSFPYFYKISKTKLSEKSFYILITSIEDISFIMNYLSSEKSFPFDTDCFYQKEWYYKRRRINTFDYVEFDIFDNYVVIPFEKNICLVKSKSSVFYIDKKGDMIGDQDFHSYTKGEIFFAENIKEYKSGIITYKVDCNFYTRNSIGNRFMIFYNRKLYGIINQANTVFIDSCYDKYIFKDNFLILFSYPKLVLVKQKNRQNDYYKVDLNHFEKQKRELKFDIVNSKFEKQNYLSLKDLSSFESKENIYISDFNNKTIIKILDYIICNKKQIKVITFASIFMMLEKKNLSFRYDKDLFDFVDAIIATEKQLVYAVHGKTDDSCFIATHIYEDINHPKVLELRYFRDNFLMKSTIGMTFVNYYYKHSPKLVIKLKNKSKINLVIKLFLDFLVRIISKVNYY
jgi:hypothetical protein